MTMSIFRPLIGTDKIDVVDFVREIGLYEETILPYKDCCSIIAPEPVKQAKLDFVQIVEDEIGIDAIVDEIVDSIEIVNLTRLKAKSHSPV